MLTPQTHEATLNGRLERLGRFNAAAGGTSLRGVASDLSGAVVAGARVTERNEQTGTLQTTTTDARGIYEFDSVQPGNSAVFVDASGFKRFELSNFYIGASRTNEIDAKLELGTTSETVEVRATAPVAETSNSEVASISGAASKQYIEAQGKTVGDFFEYAIERKITIAKNQSALVPIMQARVDAEKVSVWDESPDKRPGRALWITNSGDQTLDSGTFDVLEGGAFAGEGLIETLHPSERRLISYAADTALHIAMDVQSSEKPFTHIRIAKGMIQLTHEERETRKYTMRNADTASRQVVIEHPSREGWKLAPGPKPEETSSSFLRFRVLVGPGKTENLQLEEYHPVDSEYEISDLDEKQVALITEQRQPSPALQQVFERVLAQKNVVNTLEDQIKSRQAELDAINKDQVRIRENMKALKGSTEEKTLLLRYTRQLDTQENRLDSLNKEIAELQGKDSQEQQKLDATIQQVTLDESF